MTSPPQKGYNTVVRAVFIQKGEPSYCKPFSVGAEGGFFCVIDTCLLPASIQAAIHAAYYGKYLHISMLEIILLASYVLAQSVGCSFAAWEGLPA